MSSELKSSFDPQECASLHKKILQRATQQSFDSAQPSRILLEDCSDTLRARLLPDLQDFLGAIAPRSTSTEVTLLTPFSLYPDPKTFFIHKELPQFERYKDNLVMLYPAKESAGGLFFLQNLKLACWIDSDLQVPPRSLWFPLTIILQRWLQMWETGKIALDLKFKPWIEWDLQASLEAWDQLVDAIESRLPTHVPRQPTYEPLVEQIIADKWAEQSFQHAFLTRARRPVFSCVAPGVHVWSTKGFEAIYAAEPHDSERKQVIGTKPDDPEDYQSALSRDLAPTLLFRGRAVESTWRDPTRPSLRDYEGRGSVLLKRGSDLTRGMAGLYTWPREDWSDAVVFSDGFGREISFSYRGSCPWMPGRPPALLRDVLQFWKRLVVDGTWDVGDYGVPGNMPHYHSHEYFASWDAAAYY